MNSEVNYEVPRTIGIWNRLGNVSILLLIIGTLGWIFWYLATGGNKDHSHELYTNYKVTIVDMGNGVKEVGSKHKRRVNAHFILLRSVKDTSLITEWEQHDWHIPLTDSTYYNHKIGDTLFFKYIRKDRFWKLHKPENL
jgi:hypothetical protein